MHKNIVNLFFFGCECLVLIQGFFQEAVVEIVAKTVPVCSDKPLVPCPVNGGLVFIPGFKYPHQGFFSIGYNIKGPAANGSTIL